MKKPVVAGVDFGSDSVRVVLVDTDSGESVASCTGPYSRWGQKRYCSPAAHRFRQHPQDYLEAFTQAFTGALARSGGAAERLAAIAVDATGSTPCPVDEEGTALALREEFRDDPDAMFYLWKDHTAVLEAEDVNREFSRGDVDYTRYQGIYSSEWYWAKILHCARTNRKVTEAAWSWVEHCDWLPAILTGNTRPGRLYRGACGAGHKVLYHSAFGGVPGSDCLDALHPHLGAVGRRYGHNVVPAGTPLGTVTPEWAGRLGIADGVIVGMGSLDAHAGGVGAGVGPGTMVKVVGTSTVDMLVADPAQLEGKDLRAYCGLAENSIVPGYTGVEAGQAAFGDVYSWLRETLLWPVRELLPAVPGMTEEQGRLILDTLHNQTIRALEAEAARIDESGVLAVDWLNGRRYPRLNEQVKGALFGLGLGSAAPELFRALAVSTVFGSRRILESFLDNGLTVDRLILVGGIAKKSPYVVQMMADVLNRPVMVCREDQACARGAAMYAAVAAGIYPDIPAAQQALCEPYRVTCSPRPEKVADYNRQYSRYLACGEFVERLHAEL